MTRTATAMSRWRTRRTSLLRRGAGDPHELCVHTAHALHKSTPGLALTRTGVFPRRARECEDAAEEDWEAMLAEAARRNSRAGASDGTSVLHAVRAAGGQACAFASETWAQLRLPSSQSSILIDLRDSRAMSSSSTASCRSSGGASCWTRHTASRTAAPRRPRPCSR